MVFQVSAQPDKVIDDLRDIKVSRKTPWHLVRRGR